MWKNPNTGVTEEILIECTETRDQPKNKERALSRLRTFIFDKEHQKYIDDIAQKRKTLVYRRPFGQDTHLQLPAGTCHRSSYQLHNPQSAGCTRRFARRNTIRSELNRKRRTPKSCRILTKKDMKRTDLVNNILSKGSFLCVGLDPDPAKMPAALAAKGADGIIGIQ